MTHIDLFSGIGGFALAAQWAGFETTIFCEKDKFCHKVLNKHFNTNKLTLDMAMGKRRENFKNQQNAELLSSIKHILRGLDYRIQQVESIWYVYVADRTFREIEWLKEGFNELLDYVEELERKLPVEKIQINPRRSVGSKGKGRLNLHETDREIRDIKKPNCQRIFDSSTTEESSAVGG